MLGDKGILVERYEQFLSAYLSGRTEQALYKAQQFSRKMIEQNISPEEVINIHYTVLESLNGDIPEDVKDSFDFLIEVMMGYGMAYREHQILRDKQMALESEIEVAASMQQTLLQGDIPNTDRLEIGVISKAAKKMSGDYYHFVQDGSASISVAVADVIGKGVPAALCMSMIKYAMDSLPDQQNDPSYVLENLNRVVEQNVDSTMFITMFYGHYNMDQNRFFYAGAGHEPGFYFNANTNEFEEFTAKGLVLGVSRNTKYTQYEKSVEVGDMIVLLSDGVTECRTSNGFISRDEVISLIRSYMHLSPQEIVDNVYSDLEELQEFELRDDFTLIILKRSV
ncbi:PP2C family protein-serine/threonine phosphatase [Pseudalkalibacillus berkeleyi]|uniref:PP2C family protein-serine/threonine phosphatase n=1 Tax=Pseudalkalibacillus berkeleyi TaxID=1069813 RepID=UPI002E31DD78|nr:PP2C family protein-serine/threonine phosphatase [Pseudalkalibacillus berkeleyi]